MKRILYIQYTNPSAYPPLEHGSGILAENGWTVRFLGTKSQGASNALIFENQNRVKVYLMDYCPPGWRQKLHYVRFWMWCLMNWLIFRPNIIYVSDAWGYPIGWSMSYLPRTKVVMHEHDTPNVTGSRVNRLIGWCRSKLAKRAIVFICPQRDRASKLESELKPMQMRVVYNCPRRNEHRIPGAKTFDELKLWFHGSLVPTQLPIQVIEAMALCQIPTRLQFCGYETIGHRGYVNELLECAERLGLGDRVEYLGSIPTRKEMFAAASQCHIGLSLFAKQFREPMVGASNKPFDYLACGLTLLVPNTVEWKNFFVDSGCALACDSEQADSIANGLCWCWKNRDAFASLNLRGREHLAQSWNYDEQFRPVLELLNHATSKTALATN